jgi:RNase P subunit RPR2
MLSNPLQKYFRQPKIYISLPSKGLFYKEGVLTGDPSNVPIFSMTGMDEIIMKTPDALFNGEATVKLIESCCPYIKNARELPSLDVDALLVAIRIATYGDEMTVTSTCRNCGEENEFGVKLPVILEQYQDKVFDNSLQIGELTVNLRPLNYKEMTAFNQENFKLQKTLNQLKDVEDQETRQKYLDQIYQGLAEIQVDLFLTSIESIQTPTETVTDPEFIKEWLTNSVKESYQLIKSKLEANKDMWQIPRMDIKCSECGHEDKIEVTLDQSSFFGQG